MCVAGIAGHANLLEEWRVVQIDMRMVLWPGLEISRNAYARLLVVGRMPTGPSVQLQSKKLTDYAAQVGE